MQPPIMTVVITMAKVDSTSQNRLIASLKLALTDQPAVAKYTVLKSTPMAEG